MLLVLFVCRVYSPNFNNKRLRCQFQKKIAGLEGVKILFFCLLRWEQTFFVGFMPGSAMFKLLIIREFCFFSGISSYLSSP
jgi:hypothetical protein